jgi:hypothetical protein
VRVKAARTADGTGSGWRHNQFSIDGGSWTPSAGLSISADGVHTVAVRAQDAAGNSSGANTVTVKIDRGTPSGSLTKARRIADRVAVLTVLAADPLSGVRSWRLVGDGGTTLALGTGSGRKVVLTGLSGRRTLRLLVEDVAGNGAEVARAVIDFGSSVARKSAAPPAVPADLGPAPKPTRLGVPARGLAGARIVKGTPLPFWVRSIRGVGSRRAYALDSAALRLKLGGAVRHARVGKRRIPLIRVSGKAGRRAVTGHFATASGSRLPYPYVVVRDPRGDITKTRRGGRRGNFRVTVDRTRPGKWTIALWGRPERRFSVLVRPAARLRTSLRKTTLQRHALLRVTGRVTPSKEGRGRVVQLQWLDESAGARRWRPAVNTRVRRNGSLQVAYRFRRAGGYTVKMRVVVLSSPGSPSLRTRPREVTILP